MTKEKKSYDAVIIGAGNMGICLAAYLQRAGMEVAIFEKRLEEGSGIHTWEPTAPGFLTNHAQFFMFYPYMPMLYDFNLFELGVDFAYPEAQAGIAFKDGRPPIVLYNVNLQDSLERTHKSIARYSKHDADTWVELRRRGNQTMDMVAQWFFSPPPLPTEQDPDPYHRMKLVLLDAYGLSRHYAMATPRKLMEDLFETPELLTLLFKLIPEFGCPPEMVGTTHKALMTIGGWGQHWRLIKGGTHCMAHAMVMAAVREGVHVHENSEVTEILIGNGRAKGIRLKNGTEVEARKLVASNADIWQTLLGMVGEDRLSDLWKTRVKNFEAGQFGVLGIASMALHEAPDYKSARHDPAINKCFYTVFGYETPDEPCWTFRDSEGKRLPKIPGGWGSSVNSLWDSTYAPAGKQSWVGWNFLPRASDLSRAEWQAYKKIIVPEILAMYKDYAPNMTPANVIGTHFETAQDLWDEKGMVEGDFFSGAWVEHQMAHNRPFPEAAHYRTEIEGLYLCGPYMHCFGGISGCTGYNAYKIMAEDYGLNYRPWEKSDRGF
jgi:phytoene dehydrogenase-like protein